MDVSASHYDTLITNVWIYDGSGGDPYKATVGLLGGLIAAILQNLDELHDADQVVNGANLALAPGFIDTHAHDDLHVISHPDVLCKLSQGVTTVVVGNCGICATPFDKKLQNALTEPMNLLGQLEEFKYPDFTDYCLAVEKASPAVNVVPLIGHTTLRGRFMNNYNVGLDRAASASELNEMRRFLRHSLDNGAFGLSTGLAYPSASAAPTSEVHALATELKGTPNAVYGTHMRSEHDTILAAMTEAFDIGLQAQVPVIVSHFKSAGTNNWGRSVETLPAIEQASQAQPISFDCYPYSYSSTLLDEKQVTPEIDIRITWSIPHPEAAGRSLKDIAEEWKVTLLEATNRLKPAGAIYGNMCEEDVRRIVSHQMAMIGSDGLPSDPKPHPRLWGTFPRVLGHFSRELGLFSLPVAVRKMTALPAERFGLQNRGMVRKGYRADLVLFDPSAIADRATFENPTQAAAGIFGVWTNGVLSYRPSEGCVGRAGHLLKRNEFCG